MIKEGEISSVLIIPQYSQYIKRVCVLIAWKGYEINLKGMNCIGSLEYIDSFFKKRNEGILKMGQEYSKSPEYAKLKEKYSDIVPYIKEGNELFKQFNQDGKGFAEAQLGSTTNSYRQFEKAGCLALFGENPLGLSDKQIKIAARYAVRDYFRFLETGNAYGGAKDADELKDFENGESSELEVVDNNEIENEVDELLNGSHEEQMKLCDEHGVSQNLIKLYIRLEVDDGGTGKNELKLANLRKQIIRQYIDGTKGQDWLHDVDGKKMSGQLSESKIRANFNNMYKRICSVLR